MLYLSTYFEIAAFVTSLIAWKQLSDSRSLRLFPLLLLGIVAGELWGAYQIYKTHEDNARLYNIYITPFINVMYYGILYHAIKPLTLKKGIIVFSMLYIGFAILTTLYLYNDTIHYNVLSHCVGALFLIFLLIRLFYEMMINPSELDFLRKPSFYIFFALLLFQVGSLAYFSMANWLGSHHQLIGFIFYVFDTLNYILYGTYIVAFIWIRAKNIY